MKGKFKADQHRSTGQLALFEIPVVSFDYAFLSDRGEPTEHAAKMLKKKIMKKKSCIMK